jgi:hypothetical protein
VRRFRRDRLAEVFKNFIKTVSLVLKVSFLLLTYIAVKNVEVTEIADINRKEFTEDALLTFVTV